MRLIRTLIVAAVCVAACRDSVSPALELQTNQARWQSVGPASYSMTLRFLCGECLPVMGRTVVVTVTDGVVESRVFEDDGSAVDDELASSWPDVEGLFQVVADAIGTDAYSIVVVYDAQYGFPRSISINYDQSTVDDEIGYIVTSFTAK